jgi:hypothetical protein
MSSNDRRKARSGDEDEDELDNDSGEWVGGDDDEGGNADGWGGAFDDYHGTQDDTNLDDPAPFDEPIITPGDVENPLYQDSSFSQNLLTKADWEDFPVGRKARSRNKVELSFIRITRLFNGLYTRKTTSPMKSLNLNRTT